MRDRLKAYAELIRLDKPIGIYLLLWPTLWALWVAADGFPRPTVLAIFVIGVVLMRSAGCAINDFADRDIDPHVERTKSRPLASGRISAREAVIIFTLLAAIAFGLLIALDPLTRIMSVGGLLLAASYPFMKRVHYLPQVHLGIAFAWAIPMAFTAQTGELPSLSGWLLFFATVLWTTAYDTMYAMADREDDLKIGVKSTAILFGEQDRLIIGSLQAGMLLSLYFVGQREHLGTWYHAGLAIAALLCVYQQFLIRNRIPEDCFRAFLNNNYLGAVVFISLAIDKLVN
ncbi:MAG: 4-hydroxybenzoate octaprenyltransferase [bacterium]